MTRGESSLLQGHQPESSPGCWQCCKQRTSSRRPWNGCILLIRKERCCCNLGRVPHCGRCVLARMRGEGEQGDAGQKGAQAGPYKCCQSKGIFREGMRCWRLGRGLLGSHYHIELTCRQNEKKKRKKKNLRAFVPQGTDQHSCS